MSRFAYVFLGSKDLCIERIKTRVMQGGHDVPAEDVIRRFDRGIAKFWQEYRYAVDNYAIYFNNEFYDFELVAYGKKDKLEIDEQHLFDQFTQILKGYEHG